MKTNLPLAVIVSSLLIASSAAMAADKASFVERHGEVVSSSTQGTFAAAHGDTTRASTATLGNPYPAEKAKIADSFQARHGDTTVASTATFGNPYPAQN